MIRGRVHVNLNNIHVPQDPILRGGPVRNIMRNGVSPRRQPAVSSEKIPVTSLELHAPSFLDGLPLNRRV